MLSTHIVLKIKADNYGRREKLNYFFNNMRI